MEESKKQTPPSLPTSLRTSILTDRSHRQSDSDGFSDVFSQRSVTTTFRDTEIEEDMATSILKMQSLTSIVNDPKADSFFK